MEKGPDTFSSERFDEKAYPAPFTGTALSRSALPRVFLTPVRMDFAFALVTA